MPKLPVLSGEELINLLRRAGFEVMQHRGTHVSLQKENYKTVVPLYDELAVGTLMGILKQCGLSRKELEELSKKKR